MVGENVTAEGLADNARAARDGDNNGGKVAFKVLRALVVVFLTTAMTACANDKNYFSIGGVIVILAWGLGALFWVVAIWEYIRSHERARQKTGIITPREPLRQAVVNGDVAEVVRLIEGGAAINNKNGDGWAPLHSAILCNQTEIALVLVKADAAIDTKTDYGWTPLHCAAAKGQTKTALTLVKAGASLFIRDNKGQTPLDIAIENHGKDSEIARILR